MLDTEAEWRDFGGEVSKTGSGGDRNRIGGPSDPLGNGNLDATLSGPSSLTMFSKKVMES